MRTILWGCAILAIAFMGVTFAGGYWAGSHPESCLGQYVLTVGQWSTGPMTVLWGGGSQGQKVVVDVSRGRDGPARCVADAVAGEGDVAAACPPTLPVVTALPPALLPGQIVVQAAEEVRDILPSESAAMPPVRDLVGVRFFPASVEASEIEMAPMPRAADEPIASMPYAEEMPPAVAPPADPDRSEPASPGQASKETCTGSCDSAVPSRSAPEHKTPDSGLNQENYGGGGESETPDTAGCPARTKQNGKDKTRPAGIDTMEFRPSDAVFPIHEPGPF